MKFTQDNLFETLHDEIENEITNGIRNKKLIVLVGPQGLSFQTDGEESPIDFFIHHMSQYRPQQHLHAFEGWIWPAVHLALDDHEGWKESYVNLPHDRILDLLSTSNDETVIQSILQQLNSTWHMEKTRKGMLLGSYAWDADPAVVLRIVTALQVPPQDVTVVWIYPSSRYQQWQRLFHQSTDSNPARNYQQWMCDPSEHPGRLRQLETSLNPLAYASNLQSLGVPVTILDQKGILDAQLSLPHVIACKVMPGVPCQTGWVVGLDKVFVGTQQQDDKQDGITSPISFTEQVVFEGLVSDRDCYYRYDLLHKGGHSYFRHVYPAQLWAECEDQSGSKGYYTSLVNTTYLWQLLEENLNCDEIAPLQLSPLQSDLERVESAMKSSTRTGLALVTALLTTMSLWILLLRRRRYKQQRLRETEILRQWDHDDGDFNLFDLSTVKNCHVSGRYDDYDEDTFNCISAGSSNNNTPYYEKKRNEANMMMVNLQAHHQEPTSRSSSSCPSPLQPSFRDDDYEEIDLQSMTVETNEEKFLAGGGFLI
jgi:hypothetical protein